MPKNYITSLPNTSDTQKGFVKSVNTPQVPAMDFRSGFRDVATAVDNTNKFLDTYSKMKYEGFQADLDRMELEHLHEMADAKDPCELEEINKKWDKAYDNALKDDIWSRSYYKSTFYDKWKNRNEQAKQKIYYQKQHEFAEICAVDTLNKMSETASMLDNPADVAQYIQNGKAMLDNIEHLSADTRYKLMTNFYKDTVDKLYASDPNKAVAWLDYAGNKYDGYGLSKEEIRTKAERYNRARQREIELDYKRSQALQKQTNDIELGKLAAKIASGEAGVEDIKQASDMGLFTTNPFKEAEMYRALNKKDEKQAQTPNFQDVRQLVRTNQFENISDLVDKGIDEGLKDSEIKSLITLWKDKNPVKKADKDEELKNALKNYETGIETAEDNERLYFSGDRSKNVYDEIKKIYSEKEKARQENMKKEIDSLAYKGQLTTEYLDEAVEKGLPVDVANKYRKELINDDEAVDKQLEEIDDLFNQGKLNINTLRRKVATKEYSKAAFNYGSELLKEKEKAEKTEAKAKEEEIKKAEKEKALAAKEQEKLTKAELSKQKEQEKKLQKERQELEKKQEKERKEKEELDDFKFISGLIDKGDITKESQISVLETGGKPVNEKAAQRAKTYLKEKNAEKDENRKRLNREKIEADRKQKKQNFLDDYAEAKIGNLSIEKIRQNQIEGRYASQDDVDELESLVKKNNQKQKKSVTDKKNIQSVNLNNLRKEVEELSLLKNTTPDDYNRLINKIQNAAVDEDIDGKSASDMIDLLILPQLESYKRDLEKYGTDYLPFWKTDEGYFALQPYINELLGKEKKRPKEGKSAAKERESWDKSHAQRAIIENEIYALYDASLDNLAKENNLNNKTDILNLDDEKRTQIYNTAVERTKIAFTQRNYPDYQNDGKGTALISGNDLVRVGKPEYLPNSLKDGRFTSLLKSPSTGKYAVVLSDGTKKEITEEEYKRLGGK